MRTAFSLAWDIVKADRELPPGIRSFHGTNTRALERIMEEGIQPQIVSMGEFGDTPEYDVLRNFNPTADPDIRNTRIVWSSPNQSVAENYAIRSVMDRGQRPLLAITEPREWQTPTARDRGKPTILGIREEAPWFPNYQGIRELGGWGTFHMNPPIPPEFLVPIPDEQIDWMRWMTRGVERLPEHLRERAINRRREILQSLGWPV